MSEFANERLKKLEEVMKSINNDKKYRSEGKTKDNLIAKLSDKPLNVETISTGSLSLDKILGGGLGKGRIIEIYGAESSGKTSIALTAVGNVQRKGGTAVFLDVENALDPKYAAKLGVDTDNLAVAQPSSAEQALDLLQDLTETGVVDIIVLDSVAALSPQAEIDGDAGDVTVGLLARLMSKCLKKLIGPANETGTTIIFINQTRDKIGGFSMHGVPQTTSGGRALKFYASQRIEVKRGLQIKNDEPGKKDEIIGNEVKFNIAKNKIAPPFGKAVSVLTFNKGINVVAELIENGSHYGVIERPNSRTYIEAETGEVIGKSRAEATDKLNSDSELVGRLNKAIAKKIEDNLFGVDSSTKGAESEADSEDDE